MAKQELTTDPDGTVRDAKTGRLVKGVAQETNKNGTAGAPSTYKTEYAEQLIEFFTKDKFYRKELKSESTFGKNGHKEEYMLFPEDLPTFQGFAKKLQTHVGTLWDWATATEADGETPKYPDFADAYKRAKDLQQEMLVSNALSNLYNPIFAKFVAQNYTGMRDQMAVDHTTKGEAMPAPQIYLPQDLPDSYFEQQEKKLNEA